MDKKTLFWFEKELYIIRKHLPPLLGIAVNSSLWLWFTVFVAGSLTTFFAWLIATRNDEVVNMSDFIYPYFGQGLFWAFVTIFAWKFAYAISQKLEDYKLEATLLTWKDISFEVYNFPSGNGYDLGLKVISHKPKYAHPAGQWQEYQITATPRIETLQESGDTIYSRVELPTIIMKGNAIFKKSQEFLSIRHFKNEKVFTVIPIAGFDNESIWITDKDGKNDNFLKYGKRYIAQIEMRETRIADRNATDGCAVWCELYFHKSENGQPDFSINILNRVPEFETL